MSSENMIQLTGEIKRVEALASAAITPGHLVEIHLSSSLTKLRVHATAKGYAERLFAVEDALQGNTISDAYAAADLVSANLVSPGDEVQAWLKAAVSVTIGDKLVSAGDGTLQKITSTDFQVVATALEVLDLTATGAVATRIKVRII